MLVLEKHALGITGLLQWNRSNCIPNTSMTIQLQASSQMYKYYIFNMLLLIIREGLRINNGQTLNSNLLSESFSNEFYLTLDYSKVCDVKVEHSTEA